MLREIARGLHFPEGPIALPDGGVLVVEVAAGRLTRVSPAGEHRVLAELGGGPNGAAFGPDGRCYVCNNGGFAWRDRDGVLLPTGSASDYGGGAIQAVDLASGAVLALAVTTSTRSPQLPDVPTVAEAALPGFDVSSWFGIVAPGGVPRTIVDKLTAAFDAALKNPQVIEHVRKLGAEPRYIGPRDFDAFMRTERQKWAPVVKASGASVN